MGGIVVFRSFILKKILDLGDIFVIILCLRVFDE